MKRASLILGSLLLLAGSLRATEGFESGLGNWTPSGLWQRVVSPACVSPHAGAACLYFGRSSACDYEDHLVKDASLSSGPVSLTDPARAFVSFWVQYQVESDQPTCFDQLRLERSSDGVNWSLLQKVSPSSDPPGGSAGMGLASGSGVGGPPLWQYRRVDLSAYLGTVLYLRFRFVSSGHQAGDGLCLYTDNSFDAFLGYALDDINFGESTEPVGVLKSVAPAYGVPGTVLTYKIVASNRDGATQTLSVWDTLPSGTNFVSASNAGLFGAGLVSWTLPGVAANSAVTVSLQVQVSATAALPSNLLNVASASSPAGAGQDSSPALFRVRSNGMSLRKTVDHGNITTGDIVTYALLLENYSALTQTSLALQEQLPGGFVLTGTDPAISSGNQWPLTPMTPGDVRSFTVQGPLSGDDGQVLVNTAVLQQAGASLASDSAPVTVRKPFSPQINLKAIYPNPAPGRNASFGQGVHIAYELNQSLPMTLDVFTMAGEKLRSFEVPGTRGVQDVVWDLRNDFGHPVASGVYVIRLWSSTSLRPVPQAFGYAAVLR